jgi:hypothetical protein
VLIVLLFLSSGSLVTASSSALAYGFVIIPLVVQLIVGSFVSAALWRLVSMYAPPRSGGKMQ